MRLCPGLVCGLVLVASWIPVGSARGGLTLLWGLQRTLAEDQPSELAATLARVERATASAEWAASQQPWTPVMVQKAATLLGEQKRGEQVARAFEDARSLTWTAKGRPECQAGVAIIRFHDAGDARAYLGLAVDLQRKQDELLQSAGNRVIDSRSSVSPLRGADETARCDRRLQSPGGSAAVTVSQMWVRAGNRVVEFTWNSIAPDMDWAQRVLDTILGTMP